MSGRAISFGAVLACLVVCAPWAAPVIAQLGAQNGEWRSYGGDAGNTKYSPLDQINRDNFARLTIAWRWKSVDAFLSKTAPDGGEWSAPLPAIVKQLEMETPGLYRVQNSPNLSNFQATPLMVGGVLYFNTPLSQGVAVNARTGETLWTYNPKSYEEGTTAMTVTWRERGVAYWTDGAEARVFWGTGNGYLICVDAKTGHPCANFGDRGRGRIDLTVGLPRANRKDRDYLNAMLYSVQSPPIVVGDVVINGSSISDRRIAKEAVPGWVRAWDVRTGQHKWDFHTVPQGREEGVETWENESWKYSGNANVWSIMSADEALGYVYLPGTTPTNDHYGGQRPGDNLFAESLICVDAKSGKKVWHFQAVHHGLWDYDFPAAPNLLDINVNGRKIKVVAQVSKQGFIYTFDRATGRPVWPIEERPVPISPTVPGEVPSPTQPFPTKPAAFDYQGVTIDDLVDFTPEIRQMAIEAVRGYTLGPLFTPPTLAAEGQTKGTLMRPTGNGAANWSGAAIDPDTGWLYVPVEQRCRSDWLLQSRSSGRHAPLHAWTPRVRHALGTGSAESFASNASRTSAPQTPVFADDRGRHEHGRPRVDDAARQRRPDSQSSDAERSHAAAARRRRPGWAASDEDTPHQRIVGRRAH
jgi:quinoprotein glucose dehydrogenase